MVGTFLTSSLGRLGWALAGALCLYLVLDTDPIAYPEVIVPAARIIEREPPTEVRWRDRIVYRYVQPEIRATAPGGAAEVAVEFCKPQVLPGTVPSVVLLRSVTHNSSWLPLRRGSLLVTSMDGAGDLFAEDYRVRDDFSVSYASGVRYERLGLAKEIAKGGLWYLIFRSAEAIFKP